MCFCLPLLLWKHYSPDIYDDISVALEIITCIQQYLSYDSVRCTLFMCCVLSFPPLETLFTGYDDVISGIK